MPAVLLGEFLRVFPGFLKVAAKLNEFSALGAHGGILFRTVALGYDDVHGHVEPASGQRRGLAVISPGGRDQAGDAVRVPEEFRRIDYGSPRFKGSDWRMVFVLHPDFGPQSLGQQRPGNLRCGLHDGVDELLRLADFLDGGQGRCHS